MGEGESQLGSTIGGGGVLYIEGPGEAKKTQGREDDVRMSGSGSADGECARYFASSIWA